MARAHLQADQQQGTSAESLPDVAGESTAGRQRQVVSGQLAATPRLVRRVPQGAVQGWSTSSGSRTATSLGRQFLF